MEVLPYFICCVFWGISIKDAYVKVVAAFKIVFLCNKNGVRVKQFLKFVPHPLRIMIGLTQSYKFNINFYLLIIEIILMILSHYYFFQIVSS